MNKPETAFIQGKLDDTHKLIKLEHRKPKSERNQREINCAKMKQKVYKRWLKD